MNVYSTVHRDRSGYYVLVGFFPLRSEMVRRVCICLGKIEKIRTVEYICHSFSAP